LYRFCTAASNENLAESTLDKLKTIFEKQFLTWAASAGLCYLSEISTAHLEAFRDTWKDRALAKKKKQERLTGFFTTALD
jgi:integrase/recombinase XerD